jgi:diguanylate cyclase (GGDEF)-like protein/PAS domain S-box-containing protein
MSPFPEPSQGSTAANLRGLLELARLVRQPSDLTEVLAAIAALISETLGFATVVINLYRPESDEYEVATVHGDARARAALIGDVTPADTWSPMLDLRFLRGGAFFVPAGAAAQAGAEGEANAEAGANAWQVDDALFVPLDGTGGRHHGIIAVDEPKSGQRPDDQVLEVLSAVAAHAALAIESAVQITQLQATVERHQAVIAAGLDAVIAVDRRGRVVEFNPAAERMFGYPHQDAIGRELAELIVPPEDREAHRRGLERAFTQHEWRMLDRRMELTALRADGARLAMELTLTLVDGPAGTDALVYGFLRDISERQRGEQELTYLAYHDPLTGLPNRIQIEQLLDLALARARRARAAVALMFVDLDDFKEVNDGLGHAAGDQMLAAVAARLRAVLRESDVLARQGGDEFLVLLADLEEDPAPAAEAVGIKLLEALREPFVVGGTELRTGASIGVSLYPDDAEDTETLLRHADAAMYLAKASGGDRLAFHRSAGTPRRTSISAQLRQAMTHSELELRYQPLWELIGERNIGGLEAVLRWRHPDRGLLHPGAFINLAEHSAVGDELVDWMLREVCRQAAKWQRQGLAPRLGVNISPHQLLGPGFVDRWREAISGHNLNLGQFMIELTESAWTVDAVETLSVLAALRAGGAALAIDDFGSGYSSLARLRELDFDVLKLDPGLMHDVPNDRTAVAILRAIVDLARACEAEIVASGVEAEDQVGFLSELGIAHAQGPFLGAPLAASDVTPLLQSRFTPGVHSGRP